MDSTCYMATLKCPAVPHIHQDEEIVIKFTDGYLMGLSWQDPGMYLKGERAVSRVAIADADFSGLLLSTISQCLKAESQCGRISTAHPRYLRYSRASPFGKVVHGNVHGICLPLVNDGKGYVCLYPLLYFSQIAAVTALNNQPRQCFIGGFFLLPLNRAFRLFCFLLIPGILFAVRHRSCDQCQYDQYPERTGA